MKNCKHFLFLLLFSSLTLESLAQSLVLDIASGTDHSNPRKIKSGKSGVVFLAENPRVGLELFRSDGTAEGTKIFMDHESGEKDLVLWDFEVMDDKVYYAVDKKRAVEIRVADIKTGISTLVHTMDTRIEYSLSSPEQHQLQFTRLNNYMFFVFKNEVHEKEIWAIDYRNNKVTNVQAFKAAQELTILATAKNQVFFITHRSLNDTIKLWSLNDALKVSHAGFVYGQPIPYRMETYENSLFFWSHDSPNWRSQKNPTEVLWSTDGALQSFKPFLNPKTGAPFKEVTYLTKFDNALFFIDFDEHTRRTLWKLQDPQQAPEVILSSVKNNYGISYENYIHKTDKYLYFFNYFPLQDSFQLCRTLGKPGEYETFAKYKKNQEPNHFISNTHALFLSHRSISSLSDDGSSVNILYTPNDSVKYRAGFSGFPTVEKGVFFSTQGKTTHQFYFFNSKTKRVKKFHETSDKLHPITNEKKVAWNNKLFMVTQTEEYGVEMWVYNTELDSFYLLKDINNKNISSDPSAINAYKNSLLCTAKDLKERARFNMRKIVRVNLDAKKTTANDVLLSVFEGNTIQVVEQDSLFVFDRKLLFNGKTSWSIDKNLSDYHYWGKLNGKYILSADNAQYQTGLYAFNGGFEKPVLLHDLSEGDGIRIVSDQFINYKDSLFFFVGDNRKKGNWLWQTDGTPSGTIVRNSELAKNALRTDHISGINGIFLFKDEIYFTFDSNIQDYELWKFNPQSGSSIVKDICPGRWPSAPSYFTTFNNWLYFSARDQSNKTELWRTDGTAENTTAYKKYSDIPLLNSKEGIGGLHPFSLAANSKFLFFRTNFHNYESWAADGTQAMPIHLSKDVPRPIGNGYHPKTFKIGPYIYFQASDHRGLELWQTDGSPQNSKIAFDLNPGPADGSPDNLVVMNGEVYFSGNDGVHGNELFKFTPSGNTKEACPINITGGKNQIWNLQIAKPGFIPSKARIELWSTDGELQPTKFTFSAGKATLDLRKSEPGTYWLYIVENGKTWIKAIVTSKF